MSEDQVDQIGSATPQTSAGRVPGPFASEPASRDDVEAKPGESGIVQKAEKAVEQGKEKAGQVVGVAKDFLNHQIGERTKKTADELGQLAKSILSASEQLADSFAAPYVQRLGTGVESIAKVLKEASVAEALRRAEDYGRENPLLFLGGALLAGLAGGRVLKSAQSALADGLIADVDGDVERTTGKHGGTRGKTRRASARPRAGAA